MAKNKIKKTNLLFLNLIIFCCTFFIFSTLPTKAEDTGCCEISPSPGVPRVENLTESKCKLHNIKGADFNSTGTFHANQKVSDDGKSCVYKLKNNSSLPDLNLTPPDIKVSIPGGTAMQTVKCTESSCNIPWLAQYIANFQNYAIKIIGILAVVTMMIGGIMWLTAGGNQQKISEAKTWITGGLSGLVLMLGSYLLLSTINPDLTKLKVLEVTRVEKIDLEEIMPDAAEFNKNTEELKKSGKVTIGNYCGCINYKDSKSTTKLTTAESINEAISYLVPSSPLKNKGAIILAAANKYGFDPALFVAKCKQENGLGTADSTIVRKMKNLGSIMCGATSGCPKSGDCGTAKDGREWRSYSSWEDSIEDYFCFLSKSKTMSSASTLRELITKYCPPCLYKGKCDCNTSQYIDGVQSIMQKYNSKSFDSDKPNGSNCGCYDMQKHCNDRNKKYCTNYGK